MTDSATVDGGHDKVMELGDAVRQYVDPGMTLHLAFSGGRPNATVMEVVRQFEGLDPGFTISAHGLISVQHALVGAGLVDRVITSFAGENYPAPRPSGVFRDALAEGRIDVENWSMWSLTARLMAGAMGLPRFPVRSLAGSSMQEEHQGVRLWQEDGDPSCVQVAALRPDLVLVHGVVADHFGNVVTAAPFGEGSWGALAAKRGVLATVEEVIPPDELRQYNALVRIPGHLVRAVCRVPYGGHPYGLHNPGVPGVRSYVEDDNAIASVARAARKVDTFAEWRREWIHSVPNHAEYLRRIGEHRLFQLIGSAHPDSWQLEHADTDLGPAATPGEALTVMTARMIAERVRQHAYETVLAGIGFANLAGWVAAEAMRAEGRPVKLLAEAGMFDYLPRPGEPYVFANRNQPTCSWLTDVTTVLGALVGGQSTSCLGVLGAGQVDQEGNLNSTMGRGGRFLIGSGGANDIATCADETIVTVPHDPERLVERVSYITAPGHRITTMVTTEAVLEKVAGRFVMTRYLDPDDGTPPDATVRGIRERTGWSLEVAREPVAEPPPTMEELACLRPFDPERVFLR